MLTAYVPDSLAMSGSPLGHMLMAEAASGGKRMVMVEAESITRYSAVIGRPMTHGKVAAVCLLFLTCTTVPEGAQCSACFKDGYPCLILELERAR